MHRCFVVAVLFITGCTTADKGTTNSEAKGKEAVSAKSLSAHTSSNPSPSLTTPPADDTQVAISKFEPFCRELLSHLRQQYSGPFKVNLTDKNRGVPTTSTFYIEWPDRY